MTERISWYVMRTVLGKEQEACAGYEAVYRGSR